MLDDKKVLELYNNNFTSISEIVEILGVSTKTIQRSFRRLGLTSISQLERQIINVFDDLVKDYSNGFSIMDVCKKYNLHVKVVRPRLKELGIYRNEQPRYTANYNYFEVIDTEHKAYWLGFLMADGCITGKNSLKFGLNVKDKDMIEKFNTDLESNYPIDERLQKGNRQPFARVTITNKKLCDDLNKVGIVKKKTFIAKLPIIPYNLYCHFIRGYFDGDGCITGKINGYWSIVGTEDLLNEIQKILMKECNLNKTKFRQRHKNNNITKTLIYSGNRQINRIYNFLYKDATIYIERKKLKFKDFINE